MREYRVAAWNALGGFQEPELAESTIRLLRNINPDLMFVSESCYGNISGPVVEFLEESGYGTTLFHREEPADLRSYSHNLFLDRVGLEESNVIDLGNRRAYSAKLGGVSIVGCHFSERTHEERIQSAVDYLEKFGDNTQQVLFGDLNDMLPDDATAKVLKSLPVSSVAKIIPDTALFGLDVIRSQGIKLCKMAKGEAMKILLDSGLSNTDAENLPTMKFLGKPVVKIDHILSKGVEIKNYRVTRTASDHDAISAVVSV